MEINMEKTEVGYHTFYRWEDRMIEIIFDTIDMSTVYVKKILGKYKELEAKKSNHKFNVHFRGTVYYYDLKEPIYDRHAIEFAFRGFDFHKNFKKRIRFHVPEFMVINADVEVVDEEVLSSPLGEIACWKIRMTPRVIFTKMKFYFWIEKEYPYRFIKYEDSSGKNRIRLIEYNVGEGR